MTTLPKTQYTKSGDVSVAYQVVGRGELDLVMVGGFATHLELGWENPGLAHFYERLAAFSRLILFDKGGSGLSDPVTLAELPSLEVWMEEVQAVMDAAGSERAALLGDGGGGPMAITFAATHPERVTALVLVNSFARITRGADYTVGLPTEDLRPFPGWLKGAWGSGRTLRIAAPSAPQHGPVYDAYTRFESAGSMSTVFGR